MTSLRFPASVRDWTLHVGGWNYGLAEYRFENPDEIQTTIVFGRIGSMRINDVSAPVVASVFGLACTLIVALVAVRFVFRSNRSPSL